MNVHIATVGDTKEPILAAFNQYGSIDKLYLVHSEESRKVALNIETELQPLAVKYVIYKKIDPYDMNSIVNTITKIAEDELSNSLFINITGGTKLMSGAATAASYFVGAQAYYIIHQDSLPSDSPIQNRLVELPVPKIPYHMALTGTQLNILRFITKKIIKKTDKISNKAIRLELDLSPQTLSYHIRELDKKKLVKLEENQIDSREKLLSITDAGRLVAAWSKN